MERRADPYENNGKRYTRQAFVDLYGKKRGHLIWEQAGRQGGSCLVCGSTTHLKVDCKHKEKQCDICGKKGHLRKVCHQKDDGRGEKVMDPGRRRRSARRGGQRAQCRRERHLADLQQ